MIRVGTSFGTLADSLSYIPFLQVQTLTTMETQPGMDKLVTPARVEKVRDAFPGHLGQQLAPDYSLVLCACLCFPVT